jgi:hypothetical protein
LKAIERWKPDPSDSKMCEVEQESLARGHLGAFAQVRQQLARLLVANSGGLATVLAHEDPAVRAAGYQYGRLTDEQFKAAIVQDPGHVFEVIVRNDLLWRRADTRDQLRQLAWAQPDPNSYMDAPNTYRYHEADYRKAHPEWFADEDVETPEPVDEDTLPVTRGEFKEAIAELTGQVQLPFVNIANSERGVLSLLGRSRWLAGGVVVTLVLVLYSILAR